MKRCFLVLLVLILSAGCGKTQPVFEQAGNFYSFIDSMGSTVRLAAKPQKTAVLFSSFAEIWTLSGGHVAVTVGESIERGFAADNAVLVDTGAGKTIDCERLLSENCDFVIASADIPAQIAAAELLRKNGIACALFSVESFEDYLSVLGICCEINKNETAFETYGTAVKQKIDVLFASLPQQEPKKILFIRSGSSASSAKAKTADDHFSAAMLSQLGTVNIAEQAHILTDTLRTEEILLQDPDMIFIVTMGNEQAARDYMNTVLQSDAWRTLSAVKENKVFFLPKNLFQFKPNARWAEAYEYLAEILY